MGNPQQNVIIPNHPIDLVDVHDKCSEIYQMCIIYR